MDNTQNINIPFNLSAGQLLVATPVLDRDEAFKQSVILLLQKDDVTNGSWGVDLTKPIDDMESSLVRVFSGGPIAEEYLVAHVVSKKNEGYLPIADTSMSFNSKFTKINQPDAKDAPINGYIDLFFGYTRWGEGQLESEIENGFWKVVPATEKLVFDTEPPDLWQVCAKQAGITPAP